MTTKETTMRRYIYGIGGALALTLAAAASLEAQQPAAPATRTVTVTFDDAVGIALKQNLSIRQAENANDLSSTAVQQARMQFLPSLSLNMNNGLDVGRNFSQTTGGIVDQTTQSFN